VEDIRELHDRVSRDGWLPDAPCPECVRELELPALRLLTPPDLVGVHIHITSLKLFQRFLRGKVGDNEQNMAYLTCLAICHVMSKVQAQGDWTPDRLGRVHEWLMRWREERFFPSSERLCNATKRETKAQPGRYQPALSCALLEKRLGLIDVAADLRTIARARAMHDENRLSASKEAVEAHEVPQSDLAGIFDWICEHSVSRFDAGGKLRLSAGDTKTALDSMGGRNPTAKHTEGITDFDFDALEAVTALDGLRAIEELDSLVPVLQVRDERLTAAKPGSARWHVLSNLQGLVAGDPTADALADQVGMGRSRIYEALSQEVAAIRARLRAD
jgi:hypothetical protein